MPHPLGDLVDKFDFESGAGSAEPGLPPRTIVMAAGMNTSLRPIVPPKVWDSGEQFHPAAEELAAICQANKSKQPVGNFYPARVKVKRNKVDVNEVEFDKKTLSPATFRKFQEAKAAVKATVTGRFNPYRSRVDGHRIKVIPLGTGSALPSKHRNGRFHPFFPPRNRSYDHEIL